MSAVKRFVCRHCYEEQISMHQILAILVYYFIKFTSVSSALNAGPAKSLKVFGLCCSVLCYVNLTCCVFSVFLFLFSPLLLLWYVWMLLDTAVSCEYILAKKVPGSDHAERAGLLAK